MSNMYDILGKLKSVVGLDSKPVETKTEPVYESVEPRGDIMEAVKGLEEKYMGFKKTVAAVKKGGSAEDPEAVAAAIGRKKYGKEKFQKAAAAGKKLGEAAKPDFLDVDKDGDKKEPFKKAVKDKKQVEESGGPYELYNPKHPKFAANYKKFKAKNPGCKLEDFIAAMKKKEHNVNEGEYDPAPIDPEAVAKRKRLQAIKDRREELGHDKDEVNTPIRKVAGKAYGGAAQKDAPEADDLDEMTSSTGGEITKKGNVTTHKANKYGGAEDHPNHQTNVKDIMDRKSHNRVVDLGDPEDWEDEVNEVAPPGAKAERMVKHIKKGYAKDGKLTKREKGIAYATAWKAHNKGQVEEGVNFGDTIKNSKAELTKAKKVKVTESRVMEETDYFYEKIGKALAEKNPTLNTASGDFVTALRQEMVAQGIPPNRARNIIMMDDDFISDVASSYGHYCQEVAECSAPINSFVEESPMAELDEISRLAGLPSREEEVQEATSDEDKLQRYHDLVNRGMDPDDAQAQVFNDEDDDEDLDEGNEYIKARLDAIRAGKDVFTVGGKVHKVSGDTSQEKQQVEENFNNVTISADGYDALHVLQLLSGLQSNENEVADQPAVEPAVEPEATAGGEEVAEERDIEYVNTPREKVAPTSSVIPSGTDLHKSKRQDPATANRAANPLEETLWQAYEDMIGEVKK